VTPAKAKLQGSTKEMRKDNFMAKKLPKPYQDFLDKYPEVGKSYEALGKAVHAAGPLDEKTRALVKLSISVGAQREGAVHSHVRKALASGASPEEIRHAVLLALPTLGLPAMMAALTWVEDVLA
jgi:alkylhydroperoxidase/carboxymuconolactone decarboxylase family protein YurZ